MIQFETNRYWVPVKYIGEKTTIRATIDKIEILFNYSEQPIKEYMDATVKVWSLWDVE